MSLKSGLMTRYRCGLIDKSRESVQNNPDSVDEKNTYLQADFHQCIQGCCTTTFLVTSLILIGKRIRTHAATNPGKNITTLLNAVSQRYP